MIIKNLYLIYIFYRKKQELLLEEMKTTNTKMENQDNYEYIVLSVCILSFNISKKGFVTNKTK